VAATYLRKVRSGGESRNWPCRSTSSRMSCWSPARPRVEAYARR